MVYGCDFDTILCNCEDLGSLDYWPLDEAIECISFPTLLGRIHITDTLITQRNRAELMHGPNVFLH